jgi:excinuclease ABC subunit C
VTAREAARRLPHAPGVYRFRDARGRVLYVGRASDLRSRAGSYWSRLGDRPHLAAMVAAVTRVEAVVCDSVHEAAWLERNLLEERLPRWNRSAGGQEVPVWITLDTGARPGLRVTHAGGDFGPYLGGTRVRQAVGGLRRAYPLAYTAAGLSAAERDIAGLLRVGAGDRDGYAGALAAVLRREPAAVARARTVLAGLRERAAAGLAYEVAGRITAELRALEWVTSPQRVTDPTAGDHEVYGWAAGTQVCFTIRAGRVREWTQSARPAPRQPPPPGWADFATRNAELAAALRAPAGPAR